MKKVYALLLVAVMTVAMAVPTFAANSPEADPVVKTAAGVDVVAAAKEVKTSVAGASVAGASVEASVTWVGSVSWAKAGAGSIPTTRVSARNKLNNLLFIHNSPFFGK